MISQLPIMINNKGFNSMIRFIDLCAGIGGFHIAFENAGAKCVLSCEIDKFAQQSYRANYKGDYIFENNIKEINEKQMLNFELLCAGFPCQAFSLAGHQKGFDDIRGTIFFDIVRILNEKRPKGFLLENVKNLKSHDKGNTIKVIEEHLTNLNYYYKVLSINGKYFVPQARERVYIVGLNKEDYTEQEFISLLNNIEKEYRSIQEKELPNFWDILESNVSDEYVLSDKLWSFLQSHAKKHSNKGNGFGFGLMTEKNITSRTLTARYYKDGSEVLIERKDKDGNSLNPRRLTPRECARLMGFPEDYSIVVSKTQAYKQFGNSVVVPVVQMLANQMMPFLNKNKS